MRKNLMEAGSDLQRQVVASERSIDEGLIAQANLVATLLATRMSLGFNACVERELVAEVGAALAEGFAQRERVISLHSRLGALAKKMGIDPQAFGDGGDKVLKPSGMLSVVARTAAA